MGDGPHGTGSYYNDFLHCDVQGTSGRTGQTGWEFVATRVNPGPEEYFRGPNANRIRGGRVGQVETGFNLRGIRNVVDSVVVEGIQDSGVAFRIDNPSTEHTNDEDASLGAVSNLIKNIYLEGSAGANAFVVGNARATSIVDPFITSIGTGEILVDEGWNTFFRMSGNLKFPAPSLAASQAPAIQGFEIHQRDVVSKPKISGSALPGLVLETDAGHQVTLDAHPGHSQGRDQFRLTGVGSNVLMKVGNNALTLHARRLMLGDVDNDADPMDDVGLRLIDADPEGAQIAPVGTLALCGTCSHPIYVKAEGEGATGWKALATGDECTDPS